MSVVGAVAAATLRGVGGDPAIHAATSGRRPDVPGGGNVSLVVGDDAPAALRERAALCASVGVPTDALVTMEQVHGGGVAVVGRSEAGRGARDHADAVPGVDALVTSATGVGLMVMTADCVPVLLAAPGRGVGAVHAGRRGVEAGVVGAALRALGGDPAGVTAVIGPAIGGCCYEVPADLARGFSAAHPAATSTTGWGTPALDLPAAVRAQLGAAGVTRVGRWGGCTRCGADRWFSHRAAPGTGRQGAVIVRHAEPPVATGDGAALPSPADVPFLDWSA